MKLILANLKSPALISLIITLPFAILELVNQRNFKADFPVVLFALLWFLPMLFIVMLMPIIQNMRAGRSAMVKPIKLFLTIITLFLIAIVWGSMVFDQFPCFVGVPNCD